MDDVTWDLYGRPSGILSPVLPKVTIDDIALTLAVETPGSGVWLTEEREGTEHHYSIGQSSVCVRRIGLAWVLVGSFAEWPGARAVHLELSLPLDVFFQSDVGWLGVAPPEAGDSTGELRWEDDYGRVLGTLELPPPTRCLTPVQRGTGRASTSKNPGRLRSVERTRSVLTA